MSERAIPRLAGKTVFLSASVPNAEQDEQFRQIADAPFQIEQAVVSLARAVLSEGGRLVFGGHPSISPLVALIAGEYRAATDVEAAAPPQVVIYQSEAFRGSIPHDTDLLIRLRLAEEHWVPAVGGEVFVPGNGPASRQCPRSLVAMRSRMIEETAPVAMVCVGGMDGVMAEAELFGDRGPIFVLARTGGAAAILAEEGKAEAIDRAVLRELDWSPGADGLDGGTKRGDHSIEVIPYPLIMQTIVDRIARPMS